MRDTFDLELKICEDKNKMAEEREQRNQRSQRKILREAEKEKFQECEGGDGVESEEDRVWNMMSAMEQESICSCFDDNNNNNNNNIILIITT